MRFKKLNLISSMFAEVSICSLPTMKLSAGLAAGLAPGEGAAIGVALCAASAVYARRSFVLLVLDMQRADDEELLGGAGDLIDRAPR